MYEVREVDRSEWGLAIPYDLNNRGWIAGCYDSGVNFGDARHAAVWIDGERIDLTPEDYIVSASAYGINNDGTVTGQYHTDGTVYSGGFRWHNGVLETLPTFAPGHQMGRGISEDGVVLGQAMHEHFSTNATAWDSDLNDYDLGSLGFGSLAYDSNGWGRIVGSSGVDYSYNPAFIWQHGQMYELGTLPGKWIGRAYVINNHNEVAGFSGSSGLDSHGFYWTYGTGMIELPDLGHPFGAEAHDMNDHAVIVGDAWQPGSDVAAVVWHNFEIYTLNDRLINGEGWDLASAQVINDLGQIAGFGYSRNEPVMFLATPVDVPMAALIGPSPGIAGAFNELEVVEAEPGADVLLVYGFSMGETTLPECGDVTVDIAAPRGILARADEAGHVEFRGYIPPEGRGKTLLFQAVDLSTCYVSNLVVRELK